MESESIGDDRLEGVVAGLLAAQSSTAAEQFGPARLALQSHIWTLCYYCQAVCKVCVCAHVFVFCVGASTHAVLY
jgi:hypothetical protein